MVQPRLTGLDDLKLLSWYGFHEEHGLKKSSNVLLLFQDCYRSITVHPVSRNEAVINWKLTVIYWEVTCVFLDYTHRQAVCAHFERHLPPSLWTMALQTNESAYHLNL